MQRTLINIERRHAIGFCLAVALFELLTYMASDMIMPAMLLITDEFAADPRHVPNAFNLYLIGGVCLQWLIGPLSDRFGRRRLLLIGSSLFALACAGALLTRTIEAFNVLRLIQGMGLGFVVAVSYPALQEVFCEADAVRLMALLGNVALLSPLLAPLLGSVLLEWLSWRQLFLGLSVAAALAWLGLFISMPETVGTPRRQGPPLAPVALNLKQMRQRYFALLRNPLFVCASLALGLMSLPLIAWIGLAPLLLMQVQGVSAMEYGLWQIPVFSAVIIGNLILHRLLPTCSLPTLIRRALWPYGCGLLLLLTSAFASESLTWTVSALAMYAVGLGMSNAALYRLALFASDDSKGLMSAMIGMLSIAVMGVGGALIASVGGGNSLGFFALLATAGGLLCLPFLQRVLRDDSRAPDSTPSTQ